MRNTLETRLGIFFALALAVAVLILEMVGAFDFFRPGFKVVANFLNIQQLKKGDSVKMYGVEIGRVEDIKLVFLENAARAQVAMKIRDTAEIKGAVTSDSLAEIKSTGLLGQNYISITPGTNAPVQIKKGESVTLQSVEPDDLNSLMAEVKKALSKVGVVAEGLSPNNLSTLVGPITDFMRQNSPVMTAIIGNMRIVSDNLVQGKGTVGKIIQSDELYNAVYGVATNVQVATADLKRLMDQADSMVSELRQTAATINAGQGTIGHLVKDPTLYIQATNVMTDVGQIMAKINKGNGSVSKLINDDSLYHNVKLGLQKLDKMTEGLEDQGPLSVLGIAVNTLF